LEKVISNLGNWLGYFQGKLPSFGGRNIFLSLNFPWKGFNFLTPFIKGGLLEFGFPGNFLVPKVFPGLKILLPI